MADAHSNYTEVHRGSSFFFYHSYYVWEVETQIRALGDRFECFSLPYYDWTTDAGHEDSPSVLQSVFGGDGTDDMHCVATPKDLWTAQQWPLHELCGYDETAHAGCCLKRSLMKNHSMERWPLSELCNDDGRDGLLSDAPTLAPILQRDDFLAFDGGILMEHQMVHWLFGNGDECPSCHMATGYSMDDPIFLMLHSFTAYLRAVWSVCHGYDSIASEDVQNFPDAYTAQCIEEYGDDDCGAIELDDAYYFGAMVTQNWSLTSRMRITPRSMWNFADWGVRYDHGTFLQNSKLREGPGCDIRNVAQSAYFEADARTVEEVVTDETELNEQIRVVHRESENRSISSIGTALLILSAVIFVCFVSLIVRGAMRHRNTKFDFRYDFVSGSPSSKDCYGSTTEHYII